MCCIPPVPASFTEIFMSHMVFRDFGDAAVYTRMNVDNNYVSGFSYTCPAARFLNFSCAVCAADNPTTRLRTSTSSTIMLLGVNEAVLLLRFGLIAAISRWLEPTHIWTRLCFIECELSTTAWVLILARAARTTRMRGSTPTLKEILYMPSI